jgi:hypothetical protein
MLQEVLCLCRGSNPGRPVCSQTLYDDIKMDLEQDMRLNRIHLFHDEDVCRAFVSTVINVRVPYRARYVSASWVTVSFQGTATWNCWGWLCSWVRVVWYHERYVQIRLIRILWSVSFSNGNIKLATAETSLVASRVPHVEVKEVYGSAALFKLTQLILPEMTLRSRGSTPSCWSKAAQILCLLTRTTYQPITECRQRSCVFSEVDLRDEARRPGSWKAKTFRL